MRALRVRKIADVVAIAARPSIILDEVRASACAAQRAETPRKTWPSALRLQGLNRVLAPGELPHRNILVAARRREDLTMATVFLIAAALALVVLGRGEISWAEPLPTTAHAERRILPAPRRDGGAALATVLASRRSIRVFARRALTDDELGQLL
jgi:hypothetical protein